MISWLHIGKLCLHAFNSDYINPINTLIFTQLQFRQSQLSTKSNLFNSTYNSVSFSLMKWLQADMSCHNTFKGWSAMSYKTVCSYWWPWIIYVLIIERVLIELNAFEVLLCLWKLKLITRYINLCNINLTPAQIIFILYIHHLNLKSVWCLHVKCLCIRFLSVCWEVLICWPDLGELNRAWSCKICKVYNCSAMIFMSSACQNILLLSLKMFVL